MRDFLKLLAKSFALVFGSGLALLALASVGGLVALGGWHVFRRPLRHAPPASPNLSPKEPSSTGGVVSLSDASTYTLKLPNGQYVRARTSMSPAEAIRAYWKAFKPCPPNHSTCDTSKGTPVAYAADCSKDGCYLFSQFSRKESDKDVLGWISQAEISRALSLSTALPHGFVPSKNAVAIYGTLNGKRGYFRNGKFTEELSVEEFIKKHAPAARPHR